MPPTSDRVVLNGIDGITGQYLIPPLDLSNAEKAADPSGEASFFGRWRKRVQQFTSRLSFGLPPDSDARDPKRAGWGVVFHAQAPKEVRDSLEPLIKHRRSQVEPDRMHVLTYLPGDTAEQFLEKHQVALGDVDPTLLPYYLLLVGEPSDIPYDVQHTLSLSYAVGRLSFATAAEYKQYAESVVAYETSGTVPNHRQVSYWAPRHPGDQATQLSADYLVTTLAKGAPADEAPQPHKTNATKLKYASQEAIEDEASKDRLLTVLQGQNLRPAVLFTASHGIGFPLGDTNQVSRQGALLCHDWTGFGAMAPEHYVAASDVADDARLHGLVAFFFACFGAGTPARDEFPFTADRKGTPLASSPFVAALPRRLLSHPQGGALAVIGHVERAWGFSIHPMNLLKPAINPFTNALWKIMAGEPVGHAVRDFRDKFSATNDTLLRHLDANTPNGKLQPRELINRWIERNDARNYVVLGDPAVRIRTNDLLAVP